MNTCAPRNSEEYKKGGCQDPVRVRAGQIKQLSQLAAHSGCVLDTSSKRSQEDDARTSPKMQSQVMLGSEEATCNSKPFFWDPKPKDTRHSAQLCHEQQEADKTLC